ncbi:MAG: hypothetical protein KIT31_32660 [Deltaproteobacteria bacterium]|nr:hypothetical protein [Deltaproteobacteria bacterium]
MRVALASLAICAFAACGQVKTGTVDAAVDIDAPPDPCEGVTCECTVATQADDCGQHQVCNETGPGRVCECAPAYKLQGAACVFDGAPRDRAFMEPATWMPAGMGASVDPAAPGNLDPGVGIIDRVGMCGFAALKQTFVMPPRDRAEPFKLSVTHALIDPMFETGQLTVSVGVNGAFSDTDSLRGSFRSDTFCLGPRAYGTGAGSPVDFVIGTFGSPNCSGQSAAALNIDQLAIQVAGPGECPEPNTVVNGDFEGGNVGWTFGAFQGAIADVEGGIGDNNSRAARLASVNRCSEATMTGQIAFPSLAANANQAIELSFTGTNGARLAMQLNGRNMATITGSGATKKQRVCVPEWATGTTTTVGFFMQRASNNGCGTALSRTFTLDSIKIVNDPACSAAEQLNDPGFERIANVNGPASGWGLTNGYVNDVEGGTAQVINSAAQARTGMGALRFGNINECTIVTGSGGNADLQIIVPKPSGTAGPAVRFFARNPTSNSRTTLRASLLPNSSVSLDVPKSDAYQQSKLCLPPGLAGRRVAFRIAFGDSDGGGCLAVLPEEVAFVDDVEVTTDAGCPAQ